MNNKTELEKVKAEIESKKEEKEKYEKQLSQLKNQEKKLKKMASLEERKKRTHRLIERGAILESFIDGGVIHTYAGMELRLKMYEIMKKQGHEEETGKTKITSGYNLPATYILHTVGPIIQWEVTGKEEELLASCYRECLKLAADTGAESVAFCCLSTGVFRFPQKRAAEIATETVKNYINEDSRIKKVIFNVFKDDDLRIYHALIG